MPDINGTRQALETLFSDGWGSTTPIKYDNVAFDDANVESFVEVRMLNYSTLNVNIGGGITKRKRHIGVLAVKIFVKQNQGTGEAYSLAAQISDIMDNIMQTGLFTGASESRRIGENDGGWFGLVVDIPYTSDEV